MGKNARIPPQGRKHEDLLEGLFISPLDDSESLRKMEAEEKKILSPLEGIAPLEGSSTNPFNSSEEKSAFPSEKMHEGDEPEISTRKKPGRPESLAQEQLLLRFVNELKSIKQDLISIKEHFEVIREPQPQPSISPTSIESISPSDRASEAQQKTLIDEVKKLLLYLDRLLESLPEEKIEEFANSEYFNLYRHIFEELGLS